MKEELCAPCIQEIPKKEYKQLKVLKYKIQTDNSVEIINKLGQKHPVPDFQIISGNNNYETATDRFNLEQYNKKVESIMNTPLIKPPEEPND